MILEILLIFQKSVFIKVLNVLKVDISVIIPKRQYYYLIL